MDGNICEFVIWPIALSPTQRTNLDANQHNRFFIGGGDVYGNPAYTAICDVTTTLSNGNKTATTTRTSADPCVSNTTYRSSGKWYFEMQILVGGGGGNTGLGITDATYNGPLSLGTSLGLYPGAGVSDAQWKNGGGSTPIGTGNGCYSSSPGPGTWGFRVDMDAHTIACTNDGTTYSPNMSWTAGTNGPTFAGPIMQSPVSGFSVTLNTGQSAFLYTVPGGFTKWCSGWTC
jgi:hypothetical protein